MAMIPPISRPPVSPIGGLIHSQNPDVVGGMLRRFNNQPAFGNLGGHSVMPGGAPSPLEGIQNILNQRGNFHVTAPMLRELGETGEAAGMFAARHPLARREGKLPAWVERGLEDSHNVAGGGQLPGPATSSAVQALLAALAGASAPPAFHAA